MIDSCLGDALNIQIQVYKQTLNMKYSWNEKGNSIFEARFRRLWCQMQRYVVVVSLNKCAKFLEY